MVAELRRRKCELAESYYAGKITAEVYFDRYLELCAEETRRPTAATQSRRNEGNRDAVSPANSR
jgi:hypothetical protein